jgi:hypothetical protein
MYYIVHTPRRRRFAFLGEALAFAHEYFFRTGKVVAVTLETLD